MPGVDIRPVPEPTLDCDIARYVRIVAKHFPKNMKTMTVDRMANFIMEFFTQGGRGGRDAGTCMGVGFYAMAYGGGGGGGSVIDAAAVRSEVARLFACREHVLNLNKNPGIPQRTPPWYAIRKLGLTASDLATANNRGKFGTKESLILKKLGVVSDEIGDFARATMEHGVMFESVALECYRARQQDVKVYEYGLMPHPNVEGFGASPDGVTEWGRMVEIKVPPKRPMTGEISEQYYWQMQGQMAVTGLLITDFIEAKIVVQNEEDFMGEHSESEVVCTADAGVVVRFKEKKEDGTAGFTYSYSATNLTRAQALAWAQIEALARPMNESGLVFDKLIPWQLLKMDIMPVKFDKELWEGQCLPVIAKFLEDMKCASERVKNGQEPWDGYAEKAARPKRTYTKKTPDFEEDSDDELVVGAKPSWGGQSVVAREAWRPAQGAQNWREGRGPQTAAAMVPDFEEDSDDGV